MEKILTYRYAIKFKGRANVSIVLQSLNQEMQDKYFNEIFQNAEVEKVSREYLHEYDLTKLFKVDKKVKGEEENETYCQE